METFKKRQKTWERKEKQQRKAARKMERRNEKANAADQIRPTNPAAPDAAPVDSRKGEV